LLYDRAKEIAKYVKTHKIQVTISFMEAANFANILSRFF
jgi:hypothetical protein